MTSIKSALLVAVAALGVAAGTALAHGGPGHHHGHRHGGVIFFGPPLGWPGYRPFDDPFYFPPRPVIVQPPPMYIERSDASADPATADPNYWYYCEAASAYYPYVKECPGGWKPVTPQAAQP